MLAALFDWLGLAEPQSRAAVLQGLLSFFGVLLTGAIAIFTWLASRRAERMERQIQRTEKQRDLQRAIWSEIDALWTQLYLNGDITGHIAIAQQRFNDARKSKLNYTPFVATVPGLTVLDALKADIALLETDEIGPVFQLVRQLRVIEEHARDMRTPEFSALELERKESSLVHYLRMIDRTRLAAEDSLQVLEPVLSFPEGKRLSARKKLLEDRRYNPTANRTASGRILPAPARASGLAAGRRAVSRKGKASKSP